MEWIHCNDCYKQMCLNPKLEFLLTPCGKIQCSNCSVLNSCTTRNCVQCRKQNYNTVQLNDSMPSAVGDFFREPLDHLKKYLKVNEFQSNHRNRLLKHQSEQQQDVASTTAHWQHVTNDLKSQIRQLQSNEHILREENARLKSQLQEMEVRLKKDSRKQQKYDALDDKRHHHHLHRNYDQINSNESSDSRFMPTPVLQEPQASSRMPAPTMAVPGPVRRVHQPKSRPSQPFLNLQTPIYFPSGNQQTPIQVTRPGVAAKASLVTPNLHRPFQTASFQDKQKRDDPKTKSIHAGTLKESTTFKKVYTYMSAAAREAVTPELPSKR